MTLDNSALLDEISNMLMDCELFNNFPPAEVRSVARYFSISEMLAGEVVFHEGDIGSFMCIVIEGKVNVLKNSLEEKNVTLAVLQHGRTFGEMAVLDGERRSATCSAATDSTLLVLSRDSLDKMLIEAPRTAAKVVRTIAVSLSRRLRMADGKLVDRRLNCAY